MLKSITLFAVFFVLFLSINAQTVLTGPTEENIIADLLGVDYNRWVRPRNATDKQASVKVAVNMFVRSLTKVDDVKNEYDVQLTYRQKWKDERLQFKSADIPYLNLIKRSANIWLPDTFFSNEKEGNYHDIMARNEFARVYPNGDIVHSSRISLKLACSMDLHDFPFDTQICSIRIASYGYTNSDVTYIWDDSTPVQISKHLNIPTFTLEKFTTDNCDAVTQTGTYSCIKVNFQLKRTSGPYMVNVYIPCIMMVIVACLSFWIDHRAIIARIVLATITLFALAGQTSEINKTFPTTDYSKAIDIWTGTCVTFVFGALVEFIVVQYLAREEKAKTSDDKDIGEEDEVLKVSNGEPGTSKIRKLFYDGHSMSEKIDRVCRVAFPVSFVVFIILYAIVYGFSSSKEI